jgi:hypothetical protein
VVEQGEAKQDKRTRVKTVVVPAASRTVEGRDPTQQRREILRKAEPQKREQVRTYP